MILLLVFTALGLYVMTKDERRRLLLTIEDRICRGMDHMQPFRADGGTFGADVCRRTPWLVITPAIAIANLAVFAGLLFGDGALDDPATLVAWGGSIGPRTTNGEWWRLLTAMFVHGGVVPLVINVAAIVQLGLVLERLTGHTTFAATYLSAGFAASVMGLPSAPEAVTAGASGAVFGIYGLLAAVVVRGSLRPSPFSIPLTAMARLIPLAALFALYNLIFGQFDLAAKAGLSTGFILGLVVTKGLDTRKPAMPRLAGLTAAAFAILAVAALPLRGMTDVRPELARLIAVEERTAAAYDAAAERFRTGRLAKQSLAELIDRTILPEIQIARERWMSVKRVPVARRPVIAAANEYLRLRNESWRLRAQALNTASMRLLRNADATERASLAALEQFKHAVNQ